MDLKALNWAYNVLKREVHKLGGYVDVLLCDDKGFVFKGIFGLAGASVNDCELRGVLCALRCLSAFRTRALSANIGLAAGGSFIGAVNGGSECYVGFTMLSSVGVTLAARENSSPRWKRLAVDGGQVSHLWNVRWLRWRVR